MNLLEKMTSPSSRPDGCAAESTRRARRGILVAFAAMLIVALPHGALSQVAEKTLRVGILSSGSYELRDSLDQALVQGLREQGYVEGKNLVIERRYSSSKVRDNAIELAGMKLDAILTTCTPSTRIMKEATSSTPIVMAAVSDPVRQGIVASLARPGQNVTGTSSQAEDLLAKRIELVARLLPKSTIVAVLANARNPVHALGWETLSKAAQETNLALLKVELQSADELEEAVGSAVRARAGALFVMPDDPMMMNLRPRIVELAKMHRLPDFYWAREFVALGGLMSYGESLSSSYRNAAAYLDKIKKGADPASLPVQQPTRFELVINLKRMQALALDFPQTLLVQADEVIR
jgi:putative ABC transport system substrate-binding protein